MHYRGAQILGATYFFTVNLANRKLSLLVDNIELLKVAIRHVKMTHAYEIVAMVELPDATRWALIQAGFSRGLPKNERISKSRQSKGERGSWHAGIGNIRYAMTMIWSATSITFITTQ